MEPFYSLNNWLTTKTRKSCPDSLETLAAHFLPSSVPLVGLFLSSTVLEVRKSLPLRSPFDDLAWTHASDVRTPHPCRIDVLTPTHHGRIDDHLLSPHLPDCSQNCCVALAAPLDCAKQPRPCTIPSGSLFLVASSLLGTSHRLGAAAPHPFLW